MKEEITLTCTTDTKKNSLQIGELKTKLFLSKENNNNENNNNIISIKIPTTNNQLYPNLRQ